MRILFVCLTLPFPPTNGHRMRNWGLLRGLREEGHEVTVISFGETGNGSDIPESLRDVCRGATVVPQPNGSPAEPWRHAWGRLRALTSPLPYGAWRLRSVALRDAVEAALVDGNFDVILCDDVYLVHNLPEPPRPPVILNKHDITHEIFRRYLLRRRNPAAHAYGWLEYRKLRRWEGIACARSDQVIACSGRDRDVLAPFSLGTPIEIVPNVVDVDQYPLAEGDDGETLLYGGALDWYPNADAALFFASEILPQVRDLDPTLVFTVAGRGASPELARRLAATPGVRFLGEVPDMRAEIARATVCVVPLRIGSGTRLKILEAGAMGKAVVSTSIGAEGLDLRPDEEIVIADSPARFAQAIVKLKRDPARRGLLGKRARERVVAQYSVPALRKAMRQTLAQLPPRNG